MPHILLHVEPGLRRPVDIDDIFHLEAMGGNTRIRLSQKRTMVDTRPLAELHELLEPQGFVRVHKSHLVNPTRVYSVRRRGARDWEVKLEPPAGTVIPVGRAYLAELWAAYGE